LNHESIAGVLAPMLPHKLSTVNLDNPPSLLPFPTGELLARLALDKARNLVDMGINCSFCRTAFSSVIRNYQQVLPGYTGNKLVQCSDCGFYSCGLWNRDGTCPPITKCSSCDSALCQDCKTECKAGCGLIFCDGCAENHCSMECGSIFCDRCKATHICDDCGDVLCPDCVYVFCYHCTKNYCEYGCGYELRYCDDCRLGACPDCLDKAVLSCPGSNITNGGYKTCSFNSECFSCEESFDSMYPEPEPCSYCFRTFCDDCEECSPHNCRRPGDQLFLPRSNLPGGGSIKNCACGHAALHNATGQQFVCGFIQK